MLGKHSGLAGLRYELAYLGLELTEDEERRLLSAVRTYAERTKSSVPTFTLLRLATSIIDERTDCCPRQIAAGRQGFRHFAHQGESERSAA